MAESRSVTVVPLNGSNYSTWKIQCKMALIKDGLWGIVSGEEDPPGREEERAKYSLRKDTALATIVLAIDPSLLYLLGADPKDPKAVWKALADQFQRNTWANKLELKRKLFSLKLTEGGSVQSHIKSLTEIFDALSFVDEPVKEEDRVVYLLASLPECYNVLVTALEASSNVPEFSVVTERLLHEEKKIKSQATESGNEEALHVRSKRFRCHFCHKVGHLKKDCEEFAKFKQSKSYLHTKDSKSCAAFKVTISQEQNESDHESAGLIVQHALTIGADSQNQWILDSGATCHMSNCKNDFVHLQKLNSPLMITLGDGGTLQAVGRGNIMLGMKLPHNKTEECTLYDVLYVPGLAYNLLSVPAASRKGKVTSFSGSVCEIRNSQGKLIACGHREGSLYYLSCDSIKEQVHFSQLNMGNGAIWHRRFGHLSFSGLQSLQKYSMVVGLDLDCPPEIGFCEPCTEAKIHRLSFNQHTSMRAQGPLELVHSDVCGKVGEKSLSGGEYFVTFIDDYSRYVWIYILKRKCEVFPCFQKWKASVERMTGHKVKTLRSDNGGEYTSTDFGSYLTNEGIRHELTVPHTPEQNGVAEKSNHTLMESVRAMLADSKLPHKFWAEALSTAVFLRNQSPTKALQNVTPYEAWYSRKPDVSCLRIFGCSAYAHIRKVERNKVESKAKKCLLLG